jgi:hypothetical protein
MQGFRPQTEGILCLAWENNINKRSSAPAVCNEHKMQTGRSSTDRAKPAHTLTPLMKLLWDLGQLPSSALTRAFSTHRCLSSVVEAVDNN